MNEVNFTWLEFYEEFADKLLPYKNDRQGLLRILRDNFPDINLRFPRLDTQDPPRDIDPFSVFGLFNKRITDDKRLAIIEAYKEAFDVAAPLPSDFEGIPVLDVRNYVFYSIPDREEQDIDRLWELFETALNYADNPTEELRQRFAELFDLAQQQKNVSWNITMGLFWVRPRRFVNLDSRNRWYISLSGVLSDEPDMELKELLEKVPSGNDYLDICDTFLELFERNALETETLAEFSAEAFTVSEEANRQKATQKSAAIEVQESDDIPYESAPRNIGIRYWLFTPGDEGRLWDYFFDRGIMAIRWGQAGDLNRYDTKEDLRLALKSVYERDSSYKHAAHMTWQFCNEMKPGDVIFAKYGTNKIVGRGIVKSDYKYDPDQPEDYSHVREVEWTHRGEWEVSFTVPYKALTDYTPYRESVNEIKACFEMDTEDAYEAEVTYTPYSAEDFLDDVYMDKEDYQTMVRMLKKKMNIILQGAPGVGKTYIAERLVYSIMGEWNPERLMFVQFHQSYAYEDFVMGFRPTQDGFELKKGDFYSFCKTAEVDSEKPYFVIIDEINRGNLSKIFGELFLLLEADKRGKNVRLLYSREDFTIPENVYIIGTMNTADRSLAMLDYALRRRFAFIDLEPVFQQTSFKAYQTSLDFEPLDDLLLEVQELNKAISEDDALGPDFVIGHSYFCSLNGEEIDRQTLRDIIDFEIIPLLREYWFDELETVRDWTYRLRSTVS